MEQEIGRLNDELKLVTGERDNLKSMNNSFKNRLMEGGNMNMKDMMDNLMAVDPSEFRKTQTEIGMDGREPIWSQMDFVETAGMASVVDKSNPQSLLHEIERLKKDKRDLAATLVNTQQLLTLEHDLIEGNKRHFQEENAALKLQVDALSKRVEILKRQVTTKDKEMGEMRSTGFRTSKDQLGRQVPT